MLRYSFGQLDSRSRPLPGLSLRLDSYTQDWNPAQKRLQRVEAGFLDASPQACVSMCSTEGMMKLNMAHM